MPRSMQPPRWSIVRRSGVEPTDPQMPGAPFRTACSMQMPPSVSAVWVSTLPASVIGAVVPQIGSVGTTTGRPSPAR